MSILILLLAWLALASATNKGPSPLAFGLALVGVLALVLADLSLTAMGVIAVTAIGAGLAYRRTRRFAAGGQP